MCPRHRYVRKRARLFEWRGTGKFCLLTRPGWAALGEHGGRQRCDVAAALRHLNAPMLARAVGLDQAHVEIEGAFGDRRAEIYGQRQRIARALRMVDQRAQDGRRRAAAERADKGPVVGAGPPLPAAIAGGDPRGVVEKMRGLGQHGILPSLRAQAKQSSGGKASLDCFVACAPRNDAAAIMAISLNSMTPEVMLVPSCPWHKPGHDDCWCLTASPRAGRLSPAPALPLVPARARSPRHIRGWCGRRRTTASARR